MSGREPSAGEEEPEERGPDRRAVPGEEGAGAADEEERGPDEGSGASDEEDRAQERDRRTGLRFVDLNVAVIGGVIGTGLTFGTMYALGSVGALEAHQLLQSTLPTIRFLCSTVGTAAATILALMLTLLSLSHTTETRLKHVHYVRIRQISWLASIALLASVGLLVVLVIPLGEADRFPTNWFDIVYYGVLALSAVLGGMTFSLVLMLLNAVQGLIAVVAPGVDDAHLAVDEE